MNLEVVFTPASIFVSQQSEWMFCGRAPTLAWRQSRALYSVVQCSALQSSAMQCRAVQCTALHCSTVEFSAVQCLAVQCIAIKYLVPAESLPSHRFRVLREYKTIKFLPTFPLIAGAWSWLSPTKISIFSRPGQSQGGCSKNTVVIHWFINLLIKWPLFRPQLYGAAKSKRLEMLLPLIK